MKVFGTGMHCITAPKTPGLFFRGGDVCNPHIIAKDAFSPPWPTEVSRWYCRWPVLPFLCVKLGRFGFYIGWKGWGVDSDAYKNYIEPAEVYTGSLALEPTVRIFTDG